MIPIIVSKLMHVLVIVSLSVQPSYGADCSIVCACRQSACFGRIWARHPLRRTAGNRGRLCSRAGTWCTVPQRPVAKHWSLRYSCYSRLVPFTSFLSHDKRIDKQSVRVFLSVCLLSKSLCTDLQLSWPPAECKHTTRCPCTWLHTQKGGRLSSCGAFIAGSGGGAGADAEAAAVHEEGRHSCAAICGALHREGERVAVTASGHKVHSVEHVCLQKLSLFL